MRYVRSVVTLYARHGGGTEPQFLRGDVREVRRGGWCDSEAMCRLCSQEAMCRLCSQVFASPSDPARAMVTVRLESGHLLREVIALRLFPSVNDMFFIPALQVPLTQVWKDCTCSSPSGRLVVAMLSVALAGRHLKLPPRARDRDTQASVESESLARVFMDECAAHNVCSRLPPRVVHPRPRAGAGELSNSAPANDALSNSANVRGPGAMLVPRAASPVCIATRTLISIKCAKNRNKANRRSRRHPLE